MACGEAQEHDDPRDERCHRERGALPAPLAPACAGGVERGELDFGAARAIERAQRLGCEAAVTAEVSHAGELELSVLELGRQRSEPRARSDAHFEEPFHFARLL